MAKSESPAMHSERLQVPVDGPFQKAEWKIERIGWGLLAAFVLAGLLGLLGHGPLSRASVAAQDGTLTLDYERYLRRHDHSLLRVTLPPAAKARSDVCLSFNQPYLEAIQIQRTDPEPSRVELRDGKQTFVFTVAKHPGPAVILFHIEADSAGPVEGDLALDSSPAAKFSHFVYP